MDTDQEVALGLQSAPQMAEQMGGLDPSDDVQRLVDAGNRSGIIQAAIERRFPGGVPGQLTLGATLSSSSATYGSR